jgi:predicted dehydrogenase
MNKYGLGIVGCGSISDAYFGGATDYEIIEVAACADIVPEAAQAKAEQHGCRAVSVDELLEDPAVDIVVNLTIPQVHAEIATRALEAGKHTHCEKPFALNVDDGRRVVELGREKNLRVGCAPDTFLGSGGQACRKLLDDGAIGDVVAGTAFMMCHGHESWHPNPGFYYLSGGGPMFDMGPYYITTLINMLGPARRVSASSKRTFEERVCTSEARKGEVLPVEVTTHLAGTIDFESGAIITMVMSFDIWAHHHTNIELYGTAGSMQVPDPNGFGGVVSVYKPGDPEGWTEQELMHGYEGCRCMGVADMAYAIESGRAHRCSGELALHALEIIAAFDLSSESGQAVELQNGCERPAALPTGLQAGTLD